MGTSVGQINLDLGINSSGFKNQLNGIKKQTSSLGGAFGKLGKVAAAAFSVVAIAKFTKACLDLGSDLAEVQNVVDVTFGSMSDKVDQFAKDAMTSYGLSEKVAKQYMGTFGAMSKAFGYTEAAAYDHAAALTGLAGDVASFYNMTTDEAATKLKSVFTGETETLKELGVVMTQAALDEYALQKGMGKTTANMSEQEKVALRLAFVTDRLSMASGDFARTSDGWANQTRVLSLRFDALKASIGQGLINVLLPVIRLLNELMVYLQKAADAFSNFTTMLFGDAGSSAVGSAAVASGDIAGSMGEAASSAAAMKKSLAGFDKINILGSSSEGASSAGSGSSAGTVGGSTSAEMEASAGTVGKLKEILGQVKEKLIEIANITGFSDLWNDFLIGVNNCKLGVENLFASFSGAVSANAPNFESLKTSLSDTFLLLSQTVTTIWGDMWLSLTNGFASFTEENGPALEEFFTNITATVTTAFTLISDAYGEMLTSISEWWEADGKSIFDGMIEMFKDVGAWLLEIYNQYIDPVIDMCGEVLNELWDEHLKPLWDDLLELFTSIGKFILALWDVLKPVVDYVIKQVGPVFKNVFGSIAQFVGDAIGIVVDLVRYLINTFKLILDFITAVFKGDWEAAWEAIVGLFKNYWNTLKSTAKGVVNAIIDVVNALWSLLYSSIRGVVNGLGTLVEGIGKLLGKDDWGFSMPANPPKIPRLASGGYVEANTPQLAVIGDNKHEGEIVAPESKIAEAVAKGFATVMSKLQGQTGSQNDRPIYLTLKLGEDNFWEGFVDYHNSIVKRTGDSPLLV